MRATVIRMVRRFLPPLLLFVLARPRAAGRQRMTAGLGLLSLWSVVYARYRTRGLKQTARERELFTTATNDAYDRHYNERVPTIEEEFEIWGCFHQHRHEMRYDLVAAEVRRSLPAGGTVLDVGCGSALVADRILDVSGRYIGLDYPGHHIAYAAKKMSEITEPLRCAFVRGDGERLPFVDASVDVVVLSEVIEHLLRPELAVWEIARVLRPGGTLVMTTNNASEMPLFSPFSHLFAWLEKALGANHPQLISLRPWVWPWPVDKAILPPGSGPVYIPHTHHIQGETRRMFAAAGLETVRWSTFEFPPPQARSVAWLDKRGVAGQRIVDVVEVICKATPLVRRLGCHLFMIARRVPGGAPSPPAGVWPGPFSS